MVTARVITCSDAASRGQREDRSGPAVRDILMANGYTVDKIVVVPDSIPAIAAQIEQATASHVRLIVTTDGGGARDV